MAPRFFAAEQGALLKATAEGKSTEVAHRISGRFPQQEAHPPASTSPWSVGSSRARRAHGRRGDAWAEARPQPRRRARHGQSQEAAHQGHRWHQTANLGIGEVEGTRAARGRHRCDASLRSGKLSTSSFAATERSKPLRAVDTERDRVDLCDKMRRWPLRRLSCTRDAIIDNKRFPIPATP